MRHCDYDNSVTLMAEEAVQLGIIRPINKNVLAMLEGIRAERKRRKQAAQTNQ